MVDERVHLLCICKRVEAAAGEWIFVNGICTPFIHIDDDDVVVELGNNGNFMEINFF